MSIVDSNERPLKPSSVALAAITSLNFVTGQSRGLAYSAATLRMKCIVMAQSLRVGSLDTAKRTAERRRKGHNVIEIELQRRVWWCLVAGDWFCGASGGPNDGAYFFHPRHMNVRVPMNLEDEDLTPETMEKDVTLSVPTSMTAAIVRVKLSQLYSVNFLHELPVFFRLDAESVDKSRDVCRDMPFIALQRVSLNLAIYGRLCRLHRPFHLQDVKMSRHKYAYSHEACLADAQRLLDLRGMLEETGHLNGLQPTKSWIVVQHVSVAALILATEVSFDPTAPDAAARKNRVLATCDDGTDWNQLWKDFISVAPEIDVSQWDVPFQDVAM
ncbi:hypothetical protein E4U42_003284 [Claviceps africana]|uniref:Transcription factor domain-containing protein n=1 Tax=Claviceps africana TaxID=83212 RepID=A0A8K0JD26_9HYPO|nr:hypothetical protein E4U42_003284 [Claviceps africana]